jgi:hypothetical protein
MSKDELIAMRRSPEAKKESLRYPSAENELEALTSRLRKVEQFGPVRCRNVPGSLCLHMIASR